MYTADHTFPELHTKDLINGDGDPTTSFKLVTGMKSAISYLLVLFFTSVLQKATLHVGIKTLNMRHQAQKGVCNIFVGIPQHQKGCPVYVPHRRNIIYSYDVVFGESFSSALAYKS